jgi:hypothetical protein
MAVARTPQTPDGLGQQSSPLLSRHKAGKPGDGRWPALTVTGRQSGTGSGEGGMA